jgi:hypothetical protein
LKNSELEKRKAKSGRFVAAEGYNEKEEPRPFK